MRRQSAMRGAEVDRIRGMSGRGARAVTRGGGGLLAHCQPHMRKGRCEREYELW